MANSSKSETYYDILEVSQYASPAVIRAAYKALMQRYHPDKNSGDAVNETLTVKITHAFSVLSDEDQRIAYDERLNSGEQEPPDTPPQATPSKAESGSTGRIDDPTQTSDHGGLIFFGFTVLFIMFAIGLILKATSDRNQERNEKIADKEYSEFLRKENSERQAKEELDKNAQIEAAMLAANESKKARTIHNFVTNLRIPVPPNAYGYDSCTSEFPCSHYIEIPAVDIVIGKTDEDLVRKNIEKNKSIIMEEIKNGLSNKPYTNFTQVNAENSLASIITVQMNAVVVGYNSMVVNQYGLNNNYEVRGIEKVMLPQSFTLH